MGYLLQQIFLYCLVAFVLGLLIGWWMVRGSASRHSQELESRIRGLEEELRARKNEAEELRQRLSECEARARRAEERAGAEGSRADAEARRAEADEDALRTTEAALHAAEAEVEAAHHRKTDVETIEGIGKGYGRRLKEGGIPTVEDLLEAAATDEGVARLCALTDEEPSVVHAWAIMADLMRIRGLGGQWAELLWRAGVTSVQDLAGRDPAPLVERMARVNEEEHRVHELPGEGRVREFIVAAGELPRAIPDRKGLA
jgi:predicted flap endonuclease-1-like 5' DNA nuclease